MAYDLWNYFIPIKEETIYKNVKNLKEQQCLLETSLKNIKTRVFEL